MAGFGMPSENKQRIRGQILGLVDRINQAETFAAQKNQESLIDRRISDTMRSFSERLQPRTESGKSVKPTPEEIFGATNETMAQLSTLGIKGKQAAQQLMGQVGLYTKLFPEKTDMNVTPWESLIKAKTPEERDQIIKDAQALQKPSSRPTKEVAFGPIVKRDGRDFQKTKLIYTDTGEDVPHSAGEKPLTWPPGSGTGDNLADADFFDYSPQTVDGQETMMPTAVKDDLRITPKVREARKDKYTQEVRQAESDLRDAEKTYAPPQFSDLEDPATRQQREEKLNVERQKIGLRIKVAQAHLDVLRKAHAGKSPQVPGYLQRARGKGSKGFME